MTQWSFWGALAKPESHVGILDSGQVRVTDSLFYIIEKSLHIDLLGSFEG